MTFFRLSQDNRFAVSLAVEWLGVRDKDTISNALCDRISKMWQRWVRRSSNAVVIFASPKTVAHSLKLNRPDFSGG